MPQQTPQQVRVIDPILTTVAQGYKQQDLVGSNLFPAVPVRQSGGQVIEFGKEAFRLAATARAPGSAVKNVQFGHLGKPFALENHALSGLLPVEHQRDAMVTPGIDLARRALNNTMAILLLTLEVQQAGLATNASNYDVDHKVTLAGTDKWSDPAGTPIEDIDTGREAVRASTGRYPNVVLFSAVAWKAFRNNPSVIERIKHVQRGVITTEIAAMLLDVDRVVVGKAVSANAAGDFADVWGNHVVLAYTAIGSLGAEEPSYGYTYTMEGHPAAEEPWYDRSHKAWQFPVGYERAPVLSGIDAGYLIVNPN
jgi:hypothetical protein